MTRTAEDILGNWKMPDFKVGPITRTDIVRYAGASTDFNPLHHDEPYAQSLGHPSVFAHGMLSGGILATFVTNWFGRDSVRKYGIRFRSIVWPGDVLTATGTIRDVRGDGDVTVVSLDLSLIRNGEDTVVSGSADVVLPDDKNLEEETL